MLAEAGRNPGPYREADRLLSLARSHDEVLGVLVLHDPHRRVGEPDLFAVEQGTVVLSVELAHQRAMAESELRLRRDLVEDLLTGTDEAGALARSQALGHDMRPEHRVAVIRWPAAPSENSLARAVEQAVTRVLETGVLMARRPGGVVLIAPDPERPDTGRRWVELHRTVARSLRSTGGAIGVGGICAGPAQVPTSYAQANRALRIRLGSPAPDGVTLYDELGVHRLLSSDGNDHEVRQYVREWLGPLLDYDATSQSDLVTTLWQYLECGGDYDATARALLIHRSTLRYRLRRIREISGLDIGAVDTRLNLHIATRAPPSPAGTLLSAVVGLAASTGRPPLPLAKAPRSPGRSSSSGEDRDGPPQQRERPAGAPPRRAHLRVLPGPGRTRPADVGVPRRQRALRSRLPLRGGRADHVSPTTRPR